MDTLIGVATVCKNMAEMVGHTGTTGVLPDAIF
jgi:hypothetical protein